MSRAGLVGALLEYSGFLATLTGLAWGVVRIYQLTQSPGAPSAVDLANIIGLMIFMAVAGVMLLGIAELLRRLATLEPLTTLLADAANRGEPRAPGRGDLAESIDELVGLTREVRDISLLNDSQRTMRLNAQGRAMLEHLLHEVPLLLREHNWLEARARVRTARERFPNLTEWDALEGQIQHVRQQVEAQDVETAERQVNDLVALSAWDRVAEVLRELLNRHPESARVHALAQRVRQQRHAATAEHCAALTEQLRELTTKRDWASAHNLANNIVRQYPKSREAHMLRLDLPLLRENAEIQMRKRLEAQYTELVRQHRYGEAYRVASEVISRYPASPQAAKLQAQMPALSQRLVG